MKGRNVSRIAGFVLVSVMALSLAACVTSIREIMRDPMRYRDREATISGRVAESFAAGPRGAFLVDDRTGMLWVLSDRGVPRRGEWVKVTGMVREGINIGPMADRLRMPRGMDAGIVLVERPYGDRY
jgi:hypothetical protein